MKHSTKSVILTFGLAAALLGLALAGCDEKDVPVINDADQVIRYVATSTECLQLFAWQNFILPTPYELPGDSAVCTDSLLSHSRSYEAYLVNWKGQKDDTAVFKDWGTLGLVREAAVLVHDTFQVQTTRRYATDTLVDTSWRALERAAFFLKLGEDIREYAGWVMWGINESAASVPDATVRVRLYDNTQFSADGSMYLGEPKSNLGLEQMLYFVRVDELHQITEGSRVVVKITRDPSKPVAIHLISGLDTAGAFMRPMVGNDTLSVDTIRAPWLSQSPPQYGLYFVQSFWKSSGGFRQSYCIPYRM